MLFFSLWPDGGDHESIGDGLARLRREEAARDEMRAVIDLAFDEARHVTSGWSVASRTFPCRFMRDISAKRCSRRSTMPAWIESPTPFAKESFTARAERRCLLRHAAEV